MLLKTPKQYRPENMPKNMPFKKKWLHLSTGEVYKPSFKKFTSLSCTDKYQKGLKIPEHAKQ